MFSSDIAKNFFFVCSFYDGQNNIWEYLSNPKDEKGGPNIYYEKIVSQIEGEKYSNINNSVLFKKIGEEEVIDKQFYILGTTAIKKVI